MPAPHRRSRGESLAKQVTDHAAPRSIDNRRDRLVAQRSRTDAKWQDADARLSPAMKRVASDLERRADQVRTDDERGRNLWLYSTAVREGRAKPPVVVLTPQAPPRYFLGMCLRCDREMWVRSAKPRVPICDGCRR